MTGSKNLASSCAEKAATALRFWAGGVLSLGLGFFPAVVSAQSEPRQAPAASSVEIAPPEAQVRVGQRQVLLVYAYDRANNPVRAVFSFSSSNVNVARVDSNGIAVGVAPGTALITARTGTGAAAKRATTVLTVIGVRSSDTAGTGPSIPGQPARSRGPDGTLILVGKIPTSARVTVDGRRAGLRMKLPPGRHRLLVEAVGFQPYMAQVNINSNTATTLAVVLLPAPIAITTTPTNGRPTPAAECANPAVGLRNASGACYDVRPLPRALPAVVPPASCTGTITPASVLLHVGADGYVDMASLLIRSNCAAFSEVAVAFARDLAFAPATKNRQPVHAWVALLVRPRPR